MKLDINNIRYLVVHCSATKLSDGWDAARIDKSHKQRGWDSIGYHWVILPDGKIEHGRQLDTVGAHAYGVNMKSWGVCLIGGLDEDGDITEGQLPTDAQAKSLQTIVDLSQSMVSNIVVLGHRDLSPDLNGDGIISKQEWVKNCPCFDVTTWLNNNEKG